MIDLHKGHVSEEEIQEIISKYVEFNINDIELYQRSLVHKSVQKFVNSSKDDNKVLNYLKKSNETLEFVGDSVISLTISDYLFKKYPNKNEGFLTKCKTKIVKRNTLAFFAEKIGLKNKILLSDTVENPEENKRFLEDAFEAFIAAMYYDQGFENTKEFILSIINTYEDDIEITKDDNYKDILLRYAQNSAPTIPLPEYEIISKSGEAHNLEFTVVVNYRNERQGKGRAKIKREAEQLAAKSALSRLKVDLEKFCHS